MQKARQKTQHVNAVGAVGHAYIQPRAGWHRAAAGGQRDDVGPANAEVGAQKANRPVAALAQRPLPLDAKLGRLVGVDLGNQAFHKHLGTAHVQLVNHGAQLAVLGLGRGDDERVGGWVGLNLPAGRGLCRLAKVLSGGSGCCAGGSGQVERCRHGGRGNAATAASATQSRAQGDSQLGRFGVFQIHHINIATRTVRAQAGRPVELFHQ